MRLNRVLVQHVGLTVLASLLLVGAFGAAGMAPRPLWFVATALAVGFGSVALRQLVPQLLETNWPARHDEQLAAARAQSNDNRTQFIATWLQESSRERREGEGSRTFARRIQPMLLELTIDRLVHRHGIDPELEPERARAFVGDQVWDLITSDDKRVASLAEIEAAIQTIENL
ncbi:hypothetical protein E1263_11155 [Kribbella antibiotica]|uniref:Uncharacterized protein n=2 Tax=Kribbella antibiotica TaxID=190195 RepID=A0A4R4ZNM0_9ACTN|nr:hypothetical protein E1263_11155 [Kribbella antibiotica]